MEPGSESGGQLSAAEINKLKFEEVDRQNEKIKGLSPADQLRAVEDKRKVLDAKGIDTTNLSAEDINMQYVNTESEGM